MATKTIKAWINGSIQEIEVEEMTSPEQGLSVEDRLVELEDKPIITDGNLLVGNGTEELEEMTPDEVLSHINGASIATMTTEEYETMEATNANTLYIITDAEEETPNAAQVQANWDETDETSPSYIRNKPDENDALLLVTEMGLVQPVSTASGDILTDNNNNIIIL